ncbi:MAG: hypothetical protein BHW56_03275 [Acetobacter sp. 46_36]|nr:MAG: hypothetical protein BHW56_03275 [Acetobacter sp. 46_36]
MPGLAVRRFGGWCRKEARGVDRGWRCGEGAFFVYNLIFCVHFGGTAGKIALNKFILKALTMLTGEENRGARKVRKMMTGTEQAAGTVRKMMASAVQAAGMVRNTITSMVQAAGAARKTGMIVLFAAVLSAAGCTYPYERTYPVLTEEEELSALPCQRADSGGFLGTRLWSDKEATEICTLREQPEVGLNGVKVCPNNRKCSDEAMLPYQPCAQPMPTYYGDISATQSAEGILLIHPVTRTQILCYDLPGESAVQCAENFRATGYVLVTDIPQVSANYDFLRKNTYPTRRWRGGGEVVPRW